ncbi:MAG TPA: type II toxin-antitoxin system RelE/ParE family toxin [Euryarchaeota archaeon]|nr:type II toxin-antitoxin system RelE/ParE family toxin [Euryarchaeota archaeon]
MNYKVLLHPKANDFLERADADLRDRIRKKLRILGDRPKSGKKITHSDFWRLRVGDYRAIYEIGRKNETIIILYIGHRSEVFDDFSRLF